MSQSSTCAPAAPATAFKSAAYSQTPSSATNTTVENPIDLDTLLRRCLEDVCFCGIILHKFASRSGDQLAALERALAAENLVELAREAHTLQGVAANLSAAALRHAAEQLEAAALVADIQQCATCLVRVRTEMARCQAQVPELLSRLTAAS